MTTKNEESDNSGMIDGMTGEKCKSLETQLKELAAVKADLATMDDDNIATVRHQIAKFAYDCENPELKIVFLNLLRYAEETYEQTGIDTVIMCSSKNPDGVKLPNVAKHRDVLAALTDCLTDVYFPENGQFD